MTTLITEPVFERWYESDLKPSLERVLGTGKVWVAKRNLQGFVWACIDVADGEELADVEDVLMELDDTRYEVQR